MGPFLRISDLIVMWVKEVKVGDFVELKNSNIDDGTKFLTLHTSATVMSVRG